MKNENSKQVEKLRENDAWKTRLYCSKIKIDWFYLETVSHANERWVIGGVCNMMQKQIQCHWLQIKKELQSHSLFFANDLRDIVTIRQGQEIWFLSSDSPFEFYVLQTPIADIFKRFVKLFGFLHFLVKSRNLGIFYSLRKIYTKVFRKRRIWHNIDEICCVLVTIQK